MPYGSDPLVGRISKRDFPRPQPLECDPCVCGHARMGHGDRVFGGKFGHCIGEMVHVQAHTGDIEYRLVPRTAGVPVCSCQRFRKA